MMNSAFGDFDRVAQIDRECFPTEPLGMDRVVRFGGIQRHHGIVFQSENNVAGYLLYVNQNDCITIIRVGVAAGHRRKQIGSELLRTMKGKLNNRKARLECFIPENWDAVMDWLRANGFKLNGISQDTKPECGRDVYCFGFDRIECGK